MLFKSLHNSIIILRFVNIFLSPDTSLVLAAIPASKFSPLYVHCPECHLGIFVYWFHLSACTLRFPCVPAICCVFASGLANNLVARHWFSARRFPAEYSSVPIRSLRYIWYCRPIWLSCYAGSPK